MDQAISLVGIVGSLRSESLNRVVFDTAAELVGDGVSLTEVDIAAVPLYNADLEGDDLPAEVSTMKQEVDAADGLIIFTPEYNHGIPAPTKNVIDWMSRPVLDGPLSRAAVGVVAATPGRGDAASCRAHLSECLAVTTARPFERSLGIASISRRVEGGRVTHDETLGALGGWLADFASFVRDAA